MLFRSPILVVELSGVGKQHPLSAEKLSPVLSLFFVKDWAAALDTCESLLRFGGLGHTCVIYSKDDARVREFGLRMPAFRVLVNTPAPHGSTGITTNVFPSMTLGCGAIAGNITSDNVGPQHLMNVKRIAYAVRRAEEALQIPPAEQASGGAVDRPTVAAAVKKYLSQRGIGVGQPSAPPVAAKVVDRFLAGRAGSSLSGPQAEARPDSQAEAGAASLPVEACVTVDFVCEADVRAAIQASRKIYVGPKTIVTPSARELGSQYDILVLAQR